MVRSEGVRHYAEAINENGAFATDTAKRPVAVCVNRPTKTIPPTAAAKDLGAYARRCATLAEWVGARCRCERFGHGKE